MDEARVHLVVRLGAAGAERSGNSGAQSATKLCGAAARAASACASRRLYARPGLRHPALGAPRRPGGRGSRRPSTPLGHLLQLSPAAPAPDMALPTRCALPGPPPPARRWPRGPSPRTRPGAPRGWKRSSWRARERAGRRARVRRSSQQTRERESECRRRRGGWRAGASSSWLLPLLLSSGRDPPSSELRPSEQGPRVAHPAPRALDRTRGRLRANRVVRAGAWEEEGGGGRPSKGPSAPAASHLPSAPPSPRRRPMGSFIHFWSLYKYLLSARWRYPAPGWTPRGCGEGIQAPTFRTRRPDRVRLGTRGIRAAVKHAGRSGGSSGIGRLPGGGGTRALHPSYPLPLAFTPDTLIPPLNLCQFAFVLASLSA